MEQKLHSGVKSWNRLSFGVLPLLDTNRMGFERSYDLDAYVAF